MTRATQIAQRDAALDRMAASMARAAQARRDLQAPVYMKARV